MLFSTLCVGFNVDIVGVRSDQGGYTEILRLDTYQYVAEGTSRVFKLGDLHILFNLKELARVFGLKQNLMTLQSNNYPSCFFSFRNSHPVQNTTSSTCGCDQNIRFRDVDSKLFQTTDEFEIVYISGVHSKTCDSSNVDQFVLTLKRFGTRNAHIKLYRTL